MGSGGLAGSEEDSARPDGLRRSPLRRFCRIATPEAVLMAMVSITEVVMLRMKSRLVARSHPTLTDVAPSRMTEKTLGSMAVVSTTFSSFSGRSSPPPSSLQPCMSAGVIGMSLLANNSTKAVSATRALGVMGMAVSTSSARGSSSPPPELHWEPARPPAPPPRPGRPRGPRQPA
jgi:hypothetical protein